jgi:hypothetical protein
MCFVVNYNISQFNKQTLMGFKFFKGLEEIVWRTHTGRRTNLTQLTTEHIYNILACLEGRGRLRIPDPYQDRTINEWYDIMILELSRRGRTT